MLYPWAPERTTTALLSWQTADFYLSRMGWETVICGSIPFFPICGEMLCYVAKWIYDSIKIWRGCVHPAAGPQYGNLDCNWILSKLLCLILMFLSFHIFLPLWGCKCKQMVSTIILGCWVCDQSREQLKQSMSKFRYVKFRCYTFTLCNRIDCTKKNQRDLLPQNGLCHPFWSKFSHICWIPTFWRSLNWPWC